MTVKRPRGSNNFSLPFTPETVSWYPGYSVEDLEVFSYVPTLNVEPEAGFIKNFIGVKSRTADMWTQTHYLDNTVQAPPVPYDLFEGAEWVAVLKAMLSTGNSCRMMEVGAGWGPWVLNCAKLCELLGVSDYKVYGYEADPGRYELMLRHFADNGIPQEKFVAEQAAMGAVGGSARWPKIYDAPNAGGARPVRSGGDEQNDLNYMGECDWIDVRIDSMHDALQREPLWDLVHIDIQGWELDVCQKTIGTLEERVACVVIGTHSRKIEGDLTELFNLRGWVLEHEKPCKYQWAPNTPSLEKITTLDGLLAWRNPKLRTDWREFVA